MENPRLKLRIIELSHKYGLSHLGSNLTSVDIIENIYNIKKDNEPFVLSNGHAGLALYVVLEKQLGHNAEKLWVDHGVHPNRDIERGIWCSSGSLGHGLPIALGMALADRKKDVYCLVSDGESMEGSIYESNRIRLDEDIDNLKVYVNFNGTSAYRHIEYVEGFCPEEIIATQNEFDFLKDIDSHYHQLTDDEYYQAVKTCQHYMNQEIYGNTN